jgi:hypothetical protein
MERGTLRDICASLRSFASVGDGGSNRSERYHELLL